MEGFKTQVFHLEVSIKSMYQHWSVKLFREKGIKVTPISIRQSKVMAQFLTFLKDA